LGDYFLDKSNVSALAYSLKSFVPNSLQKVVLDNNNISDESMSLLIEQMALLPHGLKVFASIRNGFGPLT